MGGPASGGGGEIISAIFGFMGGALMCPILLMASVPVCKETKPVNGEE